MKTISSYTLLLIGVLATTTGHAQTSNYIWNGGTGNWSNAASWTGGVPNSGTANVFVDNGNAVDSVVTVDGVFSAGQLTIDAGDSVILHDNQAFYLYTALINAGSFSIASANNYTDVLIPSGNTLTLTGGGTVTLSYQARLRYGGALTNVDNTIQGETSGGGSVGNGDLTINNAGTINANVAGKSLGVAPNSGGLTNTGLMEATNGGTLVLYANSYANSGNGTITALDGSQVYLTSGITLTGGLLSTTGTGTITTSYASVSGLTLQGTLSVNDNTNLYLTGAIVNQGAINIASVNDYTDVLIPGGDTLTLTGGGTVTLSYQARLRYGGALTNMDNTIQGETSGGGSVGNGDLTINNAGTINANVPKKPLGVAPNGNGLTNTGLMEATNGGTLVLDANTYTNSGTITALDGSQVQLTNGITLTGGLLSASGTGTITTSNVSVHDLTLQGPLFIGDNTNIYLTGAIVNQGAINIASANDYTDVLIPGGDTLTLTGGGTVTLSYQARLRYGGVLTNMDNTIQGETSGGGSVGNGDLTINNAGTINANVPKKPLGVAPNGNGLTNTGLMEATNGGTLVLDANSYANSNGTTSGTITALDGSQVQLTNGITLTGGLLSASGTGTITTSNVSVHDLTLQGPLFIGDNTNIYLTGAIVNQGAINIASANDYTDVLIPGGDTLTLTGGGTMTLANYARLRYGGALINVDNTIQGETNAGGSVGNGDLAISNAGTINANVAGKALGVAPNGNGLTNTGLMEATNGGTLALSSGNFNNDNGTIDAEPGSTINVNSGSLTNYANNTLSGGTYLVTSTTAGGAATLNLDGTNTPPTSLINAATVTLSGPNSNLPTFQGLNDNQGTFTLLALRQFATVGDLSNEGTIFLDAGTTLHVTGNFSSADSASTSSTAQRDGVHTLAVAVPTLHIVVGGTATQGALSPGILQVGGTAKLAGVLEIALADLASPSSTDSLTILSAKAVTGSFDNAPSGTRVATKDGRGSFQITYSASSIGVSSFLMTGQTIVPPTVTIAVLGDGMAVEGGENGKVAIRRDGDLTNPLVVRYKVVGGVVAGVDYKPLPGVATIPAGSAQVKVKIKPIDNTTVDGTRIAKVKLKAATDGSYTLGSPIAAKVHIIDND